MNCSIHLDKSAVANCNRCGKPICALCQIRFKDENYCRECAAHAPEGKKQEGRSPALAAILSFIIPGLGQFYNGQIAKGMVIFLFGWLVIPWILGIVDAYTIAKKINEGKLLIPPKFGCFLAAAIGIPIISFVFLFTILLAAIAIPNLIRAKGNAQQACAQKKLRDYSTILENYAMRHQATYPISEQQLQNERIPEASACGYFLIKHFSTDGYSISALPLRCDTINSKIFTIKQGGEITSQPCRRMNNQKRLPQPAKEHL
ncbi:MAG: hypothetical protein KBA46_06900 [Candidatus Omnitrophica bacterium]|nr:hypothetical protein [Candidatus Omnitrophota bacterium]